MGWVVQLARAYFALVEVLCHNHSVVVVNLDTPTFSHIMGSLESGLKCLDVSISSQVPISSYIPQSVSAPCERHLSLERSARLRWTTWRRSTSIT